MASKTRVFWILLAVSAILLSAGCSEKKSTEPEPTTGETWTILAYFDGNNDQDTSGTEISQVIADIQEMEQVGSTQDVKIIVMLGSIKTDGNCYYYLVEKHLNELPDSISSEVLESLDRKNMSDPQTLAAFIQYGVTHYPADHYMLIVNDHGGGWKGVCSDQVNGDSAMMTLPEFSSTISGYDFDIILFNAPSMSMVEVAYQLKDRADYLVASELDRPMKNILSSSSWLQDLTDNPKISVSSLAQNIATAIHTAAASKGATVGICATDLSRANLLTSRVADLGSLLVAHTGDNWIEVVDARETSSDVLLRYFDADLKKFCENIQSSANLSSIIKDAAGAVENALEAAVVKALTTQPTPGYGGVCIHFPRQSDYFDSTEYVQVDFVDSDWHTFLSNFTQAYAQVNVGSLRIVTLPVKGASIYLDGEDTGFVTDTTIHGIPADDYILMLFKSGYNPGGPHIVIVEAGDTAEYTFVFGQ